MAATSRIFDKLKIAPPSSAQPSDFRPSATACGLGQVRQEAPSAAAAAAQREGRQQREQEYAEGVIPIEQLESPLLARQLLGVGPRSPAEHGDDAQDDRQRIRLNDEHKGASSMVRVLPAQRRGKARQLCHRPGEFRGTIRKDIFGKVYRDEESLQGECLVPNL